MARVSEFYGLAATQASLPFIDVELDTDTRLYVDPRALLSDDTTWGAECLSLVQDFFGHVLSCIRRGKHEQARALLSELREPNETRLGESRGDPKGRALGDLSSRAVWEALSKSRAVQTGMLTALEETVLMIPGISYDIVSDITTNLIKGPLIRFTQGACAEYGIPLVAGVTSGPLWDPSKKRWYAEHTSLPLPKNRKLLLVPKELVRQRTEYDVGEYFNNFVLEHLRSQELQDPTSSLVSVLKTTGERRVTKKDLRDKYGQGKGVAIRVTEQNPHILADYRLRKDQLTRRAPSHASIAESTATAAPDWDELLAAVTAVSPGRDGAEEYHVAVRDLLAALFYPHLTQPRKEWEIHDGRKRIDIVFTNAAGDGFFRWAADHYGAPKVIVECKNYADDVTNAELDQLAGRFSPQRGRVGLLLSRSFKNEARFAERCRDTARDERGYIIHLTDADLQTLVDEARTAAYPKFQLLHDRFDALIA